MTIRFTKQAALITAVLLACTHQAQATFYSFRTLDSLGGTTSGANGINDLGQVVGFSSPKGDADFRATLWAETGAVTDLGTVGGSSGIAYAINNAGQIAGVSATVGRFNHATLWHGTTVTDLGTLGGWDSAAYAINNAGQVVGSAYLKNGWDSHAALWSGNTVTDLGTLGGDYSNAESINNAGQIAGTSYTANNALTLATRWNGTTATGLSTFWSGGTAINDAGVVLGRSGDQQILWNGDSTIYLDSLGGTPLNVYATSTLAWSINNAGQVVGYSHTINHAQHATLWDGNAIVDLNQFLSLADINAGWELIEARDINNNGVIVGTANNKFTGAHNAFVLSPSAVPEPDVWLMTLGGIVLTLVITRRRQSK